MACHPFEIYFFFYFLVFVVFYFSYFIFLFPLLNLCIHKIFLYYLLIKPEDSPQLVRPVDPKIKNYPVVGDLVEDDCGVCGGGGIADGECD